MPADMVKKISKVCGIPLSDVESKWKQAKAIVVEGGTSEKVPNFYAIVVSVLKNSIGESCIDKLGWKTESVAQDISNLIETTLSGLGSVPCPACGYVKVPTKDDVCPSCEKKRKRKKSEEGVDEKTKADLKASAKKIVNRIEKKGKKKYTPAKRTDLEGQFYTNMVKKGKQ